MMNLRAYAVTALACVSFIGVASAEGPVKLNPVGGIYQGEKPDKLRYPEGVECGSLANIIVADTGNGRLIQYSFDNDSIVPKKEIQSQQIPYPIRSRANSKGEIIVLDGKLRKLARISAAGEFVAYIEMTGVPGTQNIVPRSFAIDRNDNLYVVDIFSGRVLVFGPSGNFTREIKIPGKHGSISDISLDSSDAVYLIDSTEKTIYAARKDAAEARVSVKDLKQYCDFPVSLSFDEKGRIFLSDKNGSRIVILGKDGSFQGQQLGMGWKEGFLRYPSQVCVNASGKLFIADSGNNRVQIFSVSE
jgi:sugar lactone lactonase YvrE